MAAPVPADLHRASLTTIPNHAPLPSLRWHVFLARPLCVALHIRHLSPSPPPPQAAMVSLSPRLLLEEVKAALSSAPASSSSSSSPALPSAHLLQQFASWVRHSITAAHHSPLPHLCCKLPDLPAPCLVGIAYPPRPTGPSHVSLMV